MHEAYNLVLYTTTFGLFAFGCFYDTQELIEAKLAQMGTPWTHHYGGRYKYLTFLNMVIKSNL